MGGNYSLNFYACMGQIKVRSIFQVLFNKNIANFTHKLSAEPIFKNLWIFDRTFG